MSTKLRQVYQFKDLYLNPDGSAHASGVPGTLDPIAVDTIYTDEIKALSQLCKENLIDTSEEEFPIRHDGVAYRVSLLNTIDGRVFVLRPSDAEIKDITELGIPEKYVELMMQQNIRGLMIFAGAYRQGKTTSASSLLASRLKKYGGVGITIEDPPEMLLNKRHGEGICHQTWVTHDGFGEACRRIARCSPSMIFMGEIRDKNSASEVIRAALNGILVICTIHAESCAVAVERLYSYANSVFVNPDDTSSLLSAALVGVCHQKLEGSETNKILRTEFLWSDTSVKSIVRSRNWNQIGNEVKMQLNKTLMSPKL